MNLWTPQPLDDLIALGLVQIGDGTVVEEGVVLCHPTRGGEQRPVVIGEHCMIRSGTVLYSGVSLGAHSQTGHNVMVRENTTIGSRSVVGTGAVVEFGSTLGEHVMIETQAYITANVVVEDYVFVGPCVVTTNDKRMLWRREGANAHLQGPTLRWGCRIGGGSVLLPGVTIGQEAMIGAGAVVSRDIPPRAIAYGNPARVVGEVPETEGLPPSS